MNNKHKLPEINVLSFLLKSGMDVVFLERANIVSIYAPLSGRTG